MILRQTSKPYIAGDFCSNHSIVARTIPEWQLGVVLSPHPTIPGPTYGCPEGFEALGRNPGDEVPGTPLLLLPDEFTLCNGSHGPFIEFYRCFTHVI